MKAVKLTDPEAKQIMKDNAAYYDKVRSVFSKRCGVVGCDQVVSALDPDGDFRLPDFGTVCSLCFHMHSALQSIGLKNVNYFRNLHATWVKDQITGSADDKKRRDRLGL